MILTAIDMAHMFFASRDHHNKLIDRGSRVSSDTAKVVKKIQDIAKSKTKNDAAK